MHSSREAVAESVPSAVHGQTWCTSPSASSALALRGGEHLDGAGHAVGDVAWQVAGVDDRARVVELVVGHRRVTGGDADLAGHRGVAALAAAGMPAVDRGVADDQLVVDGVVVADDELHERALL